jgi:alpha-pyrone synthase
MKTYISAIGTANPEHKIAQQDAARFMVESLALSQTEQRKLKALYRLTGIKNRYSVLEDYSRNYGNYRFFPNSENLEPFPGTQARMQVYGKEAARLGVAAIKNCLSQLKELDLQEITHLITVSCTGMYAPGIDIEIVRDLGLPGNVRRTAINFMGCYAAFNALKMANDICRANSEAKVLVVCVELCSLHFQNKADEDNLLSNALFGDGAAALLIEGQERDKMQLSFENFYCDLAFEGVEDMAWRIGDQGFEMRLSSYIPDFIKGGIGKLTDKLLEAFKSQLTEKVYYAIHPGGKRILEAIEQALGLSKNDNRYAYDVLENYGNMSSPTVVFVLQALMRDLSGEDNGKPIVSFAFGPGLTLESMLLKVKA